MMELLKKHIHMNRRRGNVTSQMTLDDDFNVPDSMDDVEELIMENGEVKIESVKNPGEKAEISGKLEFPDALLKRIMRLNNQDKDEKFVEDNYDKSIEELTWHLIKEQLVKANDIKVEQEDILNMAKETTRAQFAQYGMLSVPDEILDNYAKRDVEEERKHRRLGEPGC